MNETPQLKRCVIYTRKSTDEGLDKEFNSLESQFDACSAYVRSQSANGCKLLERHYDDGGYSGGNMDRPALQKLLEDVRHHEIDLVIVYKIDRISRSLSDFTQLNKLMADNGVGLISVTQQIDTSSSMGRMIVNLLMSFAQFEREMTSDRLRDKFDASRRRGIWTGGVVPYGYTAEKGKLIVNPTESPKVLFAFQRFAHCQSYLQTARDLNATYGNRADGGQWTVMNVRSLLQQAYPAGKVMFKKTGELFEGQHEAIVPFDLWNQVQELIKSRQKGKRENKCTETVAPLKGVITCGYCGCAMVPTFCTKNGKRTFHYYRCDRYHKHLDENCKLKNISASAIEGPVFDLIGRLITNEYFLQLVAADELQLEKLRRLGADKARFIGMMTNSERHRLVQLFIRKVSVRKDGIDIVVRGDGFKNLMGKGKDSNENL